MCIAVPGTVLAVSKGRATVDFDGVRIQAATGPLVVAVGDRVLVHAGCVLQIMRDEDADALRDLFAELENT